MANKAAIDFGNSNTVIAVWNDQTQDADVLRIPEYSVPGSFLIPSVISYEPDGRAYIGAQTDSDASSDSHIFRWMKRYIGLRSPYSLRISDISIDARRAAEDFLRGVLAAAFSATDGRPDELVVSVPVEAFEHYSDWLLRELRTFEDIPVRLIDEASAAAAGYGLKLHPGDCFFMLDLEEVHCRLCAFLFWKRE